MAAQPTICVCVPVWNGTKFVGETLKSILKQKDVDLVVRISVDGADAESADACSEFLRDTRCELEVQKTRLGWMKNISGLLRQAQGDYVCIQPQDDLIAEDYLSTLLSAAEAAPEASVVYSDIEMFGARKGTLSQHSLFGPSFVRQLNLLLDHFRAVSFRGLARIGAVREAGGLIGNPFEDYAADTVWMAQLARVGELHRVATPLYRKRYHANNTHAAWNDWNQQKKIAAWGRHCSDMLAQALAIGALDGTRRAVLARVATLRAFSFRGFGGARKLDQDERVQVLAGFVESAKSNPMVDWDRIFAGSESSVLHDLVDRRSYPTLERDLGRALTNLEATERKRLRLKEKLERIDSDIAVRAARRVKSFVRMIPGSRDLIKKLFF